MTDEQILEALERTGFYNIDENSMCTGKTFVSVDAEHNYLTAYELDTLLHEYNIRFVTYVGCTLILEIVENK